MWHRTCLKVSRTHIGLRQQPWLTHFPPDSTLCTCKSQHRLLSLSQWPTLLFGPFVFHSPPWTSLWWEQASRWHYRTDVRGLSRWLSCPWERFLFLVVLAERLGEQGECWPKYYFKTFKFESPLPWRQSVQTEILRWPRIAGNNTSKRSKGRTIYTRTWWDMQHANYLTCNGQSGAVCCGFKVHIPDYKAVLSFVS